MGKSGAPQHAGHTAAELPDDLVHVIFSKLDFKSKVIAGQVCKKWDQLLKGPILGARHWAVDYNLDTIVPTQGLTPTDQVLIVEQFNATIGRWLINRAASTKIVHVSASLFSDEEGVANMKVLESQLPLLAGCLAKHVSTLQLTFHYGHLFASPQLSSSAFLTFLCPMVKKLSLCFLPTDITASQFAAICELSSLEELSIEGGIQLVQCWLQEDDGLGLQEMTSDISKLVNLKSLDLICSSMLAYIPESISCLQKLEVMQLYSSSLTEVPSGLARLANLSRLIIRSCGPLRFPPSLKGLKSLTSVCLDSCSLGRLPEGLTDLSTLTRLEICEDNLHLSNQGSWWPSTLSRLTTLAELVIFDTEISVSLLPHISGLRHITKLDISRNQVRSLPEQLSSLQGLRELQAAFNSLPTVPVSVLSNLTALTSVSLSHQFLEGEEAFKISSSLLPILHPGLVDLDLRQFGQWDPLSLCHLGRAMAEVADRTPLPALFYLWQPPR